MGGRGRGRGRGGAQLSIPGDFGGKSESLPPILQPPPTFPPLDFKPYPMNLEDNKQMRYMLNVKKILAENMQESPNNVQPIVVRKDIERYCDRYQDLLSANKQGYETRYDWSRMPAELNPKTKKRKADKSKANAKKKTKTKDVDVESKLKELEKKESTQKSDNEEDEKDDEEGEDKDADEIEGEEEGVDEEMDEGTDYINNYFDNGEDYEDNEENLDDGAVF